MGSNKRHIISVDDFDGYTTESLIAISSSAKGGRKSLVLEAMPVLRTVQYRVTSGVDTVGVFGVDEFEQAIEAYNDI